MYMPSLKEWNLLQCCGSVWAGYVKLEMREYEVEAIWSRFILTHIQWNGSDYFNSGIVWCNVVLSSRWCQFLCTQHEAAHSKSHVWSVVRIVCVREHQRAMRSRSLNFHHQYLPSCSWDLIRYQKYLERNHWNCRHWVEQCKCTSIAEVEPSISWDGFE